MEQSDIEFEKRLRPRGARLWRELIAMNLTPLQRVLAEEACRTADHLERMHGMLSNSRTQWLEVVEDFDDNTGERELVISINGIVGEARQQKIMLAGLLREIRQQKPIKDEAAGDKGEGSYGDELARRRKDRFASTGDV